MVIDMDEYVLNTYFKKYLKEIRKVSDSSIRHYQEALAYISKYLVKKGMLQNSVYEVQDLAELENIKTFLYNDPDFVSLDTRGHRMYSVGFNHYYRFASGRGFTNIHAEIGLLDMEVAVPEKQILRLETWRRATIIKIQAIESTGYQCEINPEHRTFTAKATGHSYMEGHHMVPMKYQDKFSKSLDVYANVICLCPICHRLLHYGIESEKEGTLDKMYYDRADRLAASGIRIGRTEFKKLVV